MGDRMAEADCLSCWPWRAALSDMEGFGKKRDPGGFGDSIGGVDDSVDGTVGGAMASTEGDGTKAEVDCASIGSFWVDAAA